MKLSEDMKQQIENYGEEIKTIHSFVDAVRKTVGQYLGYNDTRGHINMIREIEQNAFDEMVKVDSPCHEIWVEYNEKTMWTSVRDTGRGIPHNNMARIFATQHTSSNYVKKPGEYSSGRHGVGSKVTNACSKKFIAESYLFTGEARRIEFDDGHPWQNSKLNEYHELKIPNKEKYQGSIISFVPSMEVMKDLNTTCEDVLELSTKLLYLTPPASALPKGIVNTLHFRGIKKNGKVIEKTITNDDGILSFLVLKTQHPLIAPIILSADNGHIKCDIAFTYDQKKLGEGEDIISFANMCPTVNSESAHVKGFTQALTNYFRNYMNKIYLIKNKTRCIGSDILSGLVAVVTVSHIEPIFSGQAKEIFSNKDVIPFIANVFEEQVNEWIKMNGNDMNKLCKFYKNAAELRLSEESNKDKFIKRVKNVSAISGMPSKYERPSGKKNLELIIAEGDSAKGPIISARDPYIQGVFPIRGKIINAMTNSREAILKNEEVCGIATILGAGIGKNFDINKCPFDKIIFAADADADGYDIRQLLSKLALMYFRPMVEAGRVFILVAPLYSIMEGKHRRYFIDREDYNRYLERKFAENYTVGPSKRKTFSNSELSSILFNNTDFISILEPVARNYAVDAQTLELLIRYRNKPIAWQKKFFKSIYRFLDVYEKNGILVLDGLIGDQYYTVYCNETFFRSCSAVIPFIDKSLDTYYVNGQETTLYGLMQLFAKFKPNGIQRYKGLGEMSVKEIKESMIDPKGNRTLLRLTSDDIKRDIESIRAVQSDLSSLLKDVDMSKYSF